MYLGIEIGGTKLQLGVGDGEAQTLVALERLTVVPADGAAGIVRQIEAVAGELIRRHAVRAIGCGFGGPVDGQGRVIKSHQIDGWDNYPLADWLTRTFAVPAAVGNDCDVAALAEARFGAGQGKRVVFYVTVGTGIGGGLVLDGKIYRGSGLAAAEIGHLRPGPAAAGSEQTVESIASGRGIEAQSSHLAPRDDGSGTNRSLPTDDLDAISLGSAVLSRSERTTLGERTTLTAQQIAQLAEQGDRASLEILHSAVQTLGWAIAQVITLLAPEVVVVGGGVSLMKPSLFLDPLREQVARYVFPPLAGSYLIQPAQLGEEVVVHGAVALASSSVAWGST
jgi:glucokinase